MSAASEAGEEASLDDTAEAAARPEPGAAWKAPRAYVVAVAILVATGVGLAAVTLTLAGRLEDRQAHDDIRRTAGEFITAFLTYDFGKLDEARERVLSFATGRFEQEYEDAMRGGLDVILAETEARSRVTNVEVYLSEVVDDKATAVVVADTVVEGKSGARRQVQHYVELDLLHADGRWKIADVVNLKLGAAADEPGPEPTSTTVAP